MSLAIPDYQDPQDLPGVVMPGAYGWIADLTISYSDNRASLTFYVHRSAAAAATWPGGTRIRPAETIRISCGDPVPGYPDVTFPELADVMTRAATLAASMMAGVGGGSPEEQASTLAAIATGSAIRASLYSYLVELVFPAATEVE